MDVIRGIYILGVIALCFYPWQKHLKPAHDSFLDQRGYRCPQWIMDIGTMMLIMGWPLLLAFTALEQCRRSMGKSK